MAKVHFVSWIDAKTNPPKENGRYWCNVADQNDLGLSFYQWNCSYNVTDKMWSSNAMSKTVTHWTPLLPNPVIK